MSHSRAIQSNIVLPGDTNTHQTMFGGLLMKRIDETAAISARRHCGRAVVTASNDGVHFHQPIHRDDVVTIQSYVCSVGQTSMEVFVKITTERANQRDQKSIAAISFLTFVAMDEAGLLVAVPMVQPESDEEKMVHQDREHRKSARLRKREETIELIKTLSTEE